jgi:hypothetical protein
METKQPNLDQFLGAEYGNDTKICPLTLVFQLQSWYEIRVFFALSVTPLDKSRQHCSIVALQSYHVISHCHRLVLHHVTSSCRLQRAFSFYVVFSELGQTVVICSRNEFLEISFLCVIIFVV